MGTTNLGAWLKRTRENADLTQADLERLTRTFGARISRTQLGQLERNERQLHTLSAPHADALRLALSIPSRQWEEVTGVRAPTRESPPAPATEPAPLEAPITAPTQLVLHVTHTVPQVPAGALVHLEPTNPTELVHGTLYVIRDATGLSVAEFRVYPFGRGFVTGTAYQVGTRPRDAQVLGRVSGFTLLAGQIPPER